MKLRYITVFLFFLTASVAFSQKKLIGYTYSMSVPMGNIKDYISAPSFRGVNFEGLIKLNDKLSVGWLAGWNVFSEEHPNDIYVKDNLTIAGTQYRYKNMFPLLARVANHMGKATGARPYAAAGAGLTPEIMRTDVGLYSFKYDGWHLSLAPEAGINIPVSGGALTGSIRYIYGFKTQDLKSISYFSVNLGFLFKADKRNSL
jgi:hypothetical protein